MEEEIDLKYRVLITTSGIGSRLLDLTTNTNKSLVKVKGKEVISYIVESYSKDVEIVVALGYFGSKIEQFLLDRYPERRFIFVNVDKYQGEGSSLGYSMLQTRDKLQCPFIFHCNDTIVLDKIPTPDKNWNGGSKGLDPEVFSSEFLSSFSVDNDKVARINPKGEKKYDYFHIGLVGINEYTKFWEVLENCYKSDPTDSSLNDCSAIRVMLQNGSVFSLQKFKNWFDTGNLQSLDFAEAHI